MKKLIFAFTFMILGTVSRAVEVGSGASSPTLHPPGEPLSEATQELGQELAKFQNNAPIQGLTIYLVGFHPMKNKPDHQMEAHHFCKQVNEDFAQCALFDGNTKDANLNGVEYIISERLFQSLPEEEKSYWHPHNGEILSGQLVAPGAPQEMDHKLMKSKMNSYGKTWHFWESNPFEGTGSRLPLGEPMLAWSFNRFGEAKEGLVEKRDRTMKIDTESLRQDRKDLISEARPQRGVDALKGAFRGPTSNIPGVESSDPEDGAIERSK